MCSVRSDIGGVKTDIGNVSAELNSVKADLSARISQLQDANVKFQGTLRAESVMSPCSILSLSILVTTLSGMRVLCKLSLDCCTLFISESVPSCNGTRYSHFL
jgi:hypothetical protein